MRQARAAFQPCPPPPSEPEQPIPGFVIHHWKCHRVYRFILIPFDANDDEDPQKVFLCLECADRVWRRRQGGTGNIIKHIQSRHSGLIVREAASEMAAQHPILGNSRLLGLVLEQYLPFTFADSPRIKGLLSRPTSRKGLAKYADDIARSLETKIADDLQNARTFALVMDEWTDGKNRPFLGVKIHCCIEGPHPGYKAVALAHVPMEERDSDAIAKLAMDVLQRYRLETRVQFVVTDTAKVMSCAVKKKLNMIWWPCWAHILNLMLSDIVTSVKPEGLDWLIALAGRLPRSWHWQKIVTRADQYQIDSVGTYTPTRWYSLTKVVQHSLQLREAIEEFVATEPMGKKKKKKSRQRPAQVPDGFWENLERLVPVLTTFSNATSSLESEVFGTCSRLYDWLWLLRQCCDEVAAEWEAFASGWTAAYSRVLEYLGPDEAGVEPTRGLHLGSNYFLNDRILIATLLNPGAYSHSSLSPGTLLKANQLLQDLYNQRVAPDPLSDPVGEAPSEDEDSAVPPRIRGYTFDDLELAAQPEGRDELTRYLALDKTDCLEQRGAFDLFGWWSQHQRTFPVLYNLALEFLSIPASSATVERQFSKAKLIHSPRRQSMSGKRLGDLVFLREHLDTIDHIEPTMPRDESDEE